MRGEKNSHLPTSSLSDMCHSLGSLQKVMSTALFCAQGESITLSMNPVICLTVLMVAVDSEHWLCNGKRFYATHKNTKAKAPGVVTHSHLDRAGTGL